MFRILDEQLLDGPHEVVTVMRPWRVAYPIASDDHRSAIEAVQFLCQAWGGAAGALFPVHDTGKVDPLFERMLAGDLIDDVVGNQRLSATSPLGVVEVPSQQTRRYSRLQFAPALLRYREQSTYLSLEIAELDSADPWCGIYAVCLGSLPLQPSSELLAEGGLLPDLSFGDFLTIERVATAGSLDDLVRRLSSRVKLTPKQVAMYELPNRNPVGWGFSAGDQLLPRRGVTRTTVGPNLLVLCSEGDSRDLALLWNLRSKFGDSRTLPMGMPANEFGREAVQSLVSHVEHSSFSRAGSALYVTSVSIKCDELEALLGPVLGASGSIGVKVVAPREVLHLGLPAGRERRESVVWSSGQAKIHPVPDDEFRALLRNPAFGSLTAISIDTQVPDQPFPRLEEARIAGNNAEFVNSWLTYWTSGRLDGKARDLHWPSPMLAARAIVRTSGLDLRESVAGRSARLLIEGLGGLEWVRLLLHEPLLKLIGEMAAREGMSWQRRRNRERGSVPLDAREAVAPSADQLVEYHSARFREALGNSTKATSAWLDWAERAELVVKGIQVECRDCRGKQWIPVNAFAPPLVCRGCSRTLRQPLQNHDAVQFWYRISERLRRVVETDSLGHVLASYWFAMAFEHGGPEKLLAIHPGLEVVDTATNRVIGEADVMLFAEDGKFIPIEVKSSSRGLTEREMAKLQRVATRLDSPWTGTVVATYGTRQGLDPRFFQRCDAFSRRYQHINLTYDHILDEMPLMSISGDPFDRDCISEEEIQARESRFVSSLTGEQAIGQFNWLEHTMLRSPDSE